MAFASFFLGFLGLVGLLANCEIACLASERLCAWLVRWRRGWCYYKGVDCREDKDVHEYHQRDTRFRRHVNNNGSKLEKETSIVLPPSVSQCKSFYSNIFHIHIDAIYIH